MCYRIILLKETSKLFYTELENTRNLFRVIEILSIRIHYCMIQFLENSYYILVWIYECMDTYQSSDHFTLDYMY